MKPFENFDITFSEGLDKVLKSVKNFKDSDKRILILNGKTGTGKTHLAKEVQKQFGTRKNPNYNVTGRLRNCAYLSALNLHLLFMEYWFKNLNYETGCDFTYENLFFRDCVIIDDLGTEPVDKSGYFKAGFKEFLDKFKGKIIITTNLSDKSLKLKYDKKIYSRLNEHMVWVTVDGRDYRLEGK